MQLLVQIADFSVLHHAVDTKITQIGNGSIGAKARGLAFANHLFSQWKPNEASMEIVIPWRVVLSTETLDRLLEENPTLPDGGAQNRELRARFQSARLPADIVRDLEEAIQSMTRPLAIRSSGILEDSQHLPFAGIYSTYMLPNDHPDPSVRRAQLVAGIKSVLASKFFQNARRYLENTPYSIGDERMAVIIQELIGHTRGNVFYPLISRTTISRKHYAVGGQLSEEGIVNLAFGLGVSLAAGEPGLMFSPPRPHVLPLYSPSGLSIAGNMTRDCHHSPGKQLRSEWL